MAGVIGKVTAGGGTHSIAATFYGTCDTAAATAAKQVIINDADVTEASFINGMTLAVKFTYANGNASPTLTCYNNSGSAASPTKGSTTLLASKNIYRYGTTKPGTTADTSWQAGSIVLFVYDGTGWEIVNWLNDNTTYSTYSLGIGYGTCATAATTTAKVVTHANYTLVDGGINVVKFTYANTKANPTLNVNSKGAKPIYWKGAALTDTALIKAGDIVTFCYNTADVSTGCYEIISISPSTLETTSIPNVTDVGTAPSLTVTSTTVGNSLTKTVLTDTGASSALTVTANDNGAGTTDYSLDLSSVLTSDTTLGTTSVGSASDWNAGSVPTLGTAITAVTNVK